MKNKRDLRIDRNKEIESNFRICTYTERAMADFCCAQHISVFACLLQYICVNHKCNVPLNGSIKHRASSVYVKNHCAKFYLFHHTINVVIIKQNIL